MKSTIDSIKATISQPQIFNPAPIQEMNTVIIGSHTVVVDYKWKIKQQISKECKTLIL